MWFHFYNPPPENPNHTHSAVEAQGFAIHLCGSTGLRINPWGSIGLRIYRRGPLDTGLTLWGSTVPLIDPWSLLAPGLTPEVYWFPD